jgi:hypothetical protein
MLRQFPFAAKNALNDVALAFQSRQREWQEQEFEIRAHGFFRRAVKIERSGFATVNNLTAIVGIDPRPANIREASSREDIFIRQEEGGTRKPQGGNRALAIPQAEVGRTARKLIKTGEYPNKLKNKFIRVFASGAAGIFQRVGRRQKAFTQGVKGRPGLRQDPNVRFLYYLAPEADIDPALNFFVNARIAFLTTWDDAFKLRLKEAFASLKV